MSATPQNGFELAIEHYIDAPPATVWKVWVEQIEQWWCPKPWTTKFEEFDLRPGGSMLGMMSGPDGQSSPMDGVFLEVVPAQRVVFCDAFKADWIPHKPFMVGIFTLAPEGKGTRYRAAARHWDEAGMKEHAAMGFEPGWTAVAAQLAALAEKT